MATRCPDQLTRKQIVRLAAAISADKMESIAEGYMDISPETIKNIRRDASNSEAFNRDIIRYWANKNPENQVQKLAQILYEAAEDCGYVDPKKVEKILDTSPEDPRLPKPPKGSASRCIMCELRDLLDLLRAHIPTTVGAEYISNFCEVVNINPMEPGDPREVFQSFQQNKEEITASYTFTFNQEVTCLGCDSGNIRLFNEVLITLDRDIDSVRHGVVDYFTPELVEDFNCRRCGGTTVASKSRTMLWHPQYLAVHKNGGSATELELMLQIAEEFYELVSFIEYVGRLPKKESNFTKGHFISYRLVTGTWIRNDDERCYTTDVQGAYKFNMAFYRRLCDETVCTFNVQQEGMLRWKKSVVIRGVYKGQRSSSSRSSSRRGRMRQSAKTTTTLTVTSDDVSSVPETSSEEESEQLTKDPTFCPTVATSSRVSSNYETRNASRLRASVGAITKHIALDETGSPFIINPDRKPRGRRPVRGSRGRARRPSAVRRTSGNVHSTRRSPDKTHGASSSTSSDDENAEGQTGVAKDISDGEATEVLEHASEEDNSSISFVPSSAGYTSKRQYKRSASPVFSVNDSAQSSDDSASTVELNVTSTPPARMILRSTKPKKREQLASVEKEDANRNRPTVDITVHRTDSGSSSESAKESSEEEQEQVPNKSDHRSSENSEHLQQDSLPPVQSDRTQTKYGRKNTRKRQVQFKLPTQRTVRRDRVDQQCRAFNIKYRRWPGTREPKDFLHKSHSRFVDGTDGLPRNQKVPGDCILCPEQKYLKDDWEAMRHYRPVHIENLLVMDEIVMLQCKCNAVRSRGWDRDHSTRNAHYHCSVCHWPRDKASQIQNHLKVIHGKAVHEIRHLKGQRRRKKEM